MLALHQQIEIDYPTCTLVNAQLEFRPRKLVVKKVRDLVVDPLTPADYLRRPLNHRGRWLILARDLETGQLRQFYWSTVKDHFRPLPLRLGLYGPGNHRPLELLSRPFEPVVRDRILLARAIQIWSKKVDQSLRLGVFCDDLRVVKD